MIGFYNYTVILTYVSMLISFTGICFAISGDLRASLLCLLLSGLCDMFDGGIASTKKDRSEDEKHFGIEIDSLSDLICFGVLPAIITVVFFGGNALSYIAGGMLILGALIRLSFFDVDEYKRQKLTTEHRVHYLGLPVTSVALSVPWAVFFSRAFSFDGRYIVIPVLVITAVCFISPIRLKKPALWGKILLIVLGVIQLVVLLTGVNLYAI